MSVNTHTQHTFAGKYLTYNASEQVLIIAQKSETSFKLIVSLFFGNKLFLYVLQIQRVSSRLINIRLLLLASVYLLVTIVMKATGLSIFDSFF